MTGPGGLEVEFIFFKDLLCGSFSLKKPTLLFWFGFPTLGAQARVFHSFLDNGGAPCTGTQVQIATALAFYQEGFAAVYLAILVAHALTCSFLHDWFYFSFWHVL